MRTKVSMWLHKITFNFKGTLYCHDEKCDNKILDTHFRAVEKPSNLIDSIIHINFLKICIHTHSIIFESMFVVSFWLPIISERGTSANNSWRKICRN